MELKVLFLLAFLLTFMQATLGLECEEDTFLEIRKVRPLDFLATRQKAGTSYKKCKGLCLEDDDCEGFSFRKKNPRGRLNRRGQRCFLYSVYVTNSEFRAMKNENYYRRLRCDVLDFCEETNQGLDYDGQQSVTLNGYTCQRWDASEPHNISVDLYMPEEELNDAENYCRNADKGILGPWCYTTDPDKEWDDCLVICPETCGGYITKSAGVISSPYYPEEYYNNINCTWTIIAKRGKKIEITFNYFALEDDWDFVTVYDGDEELGSYTGYDLPSTLMSTGKKMKVVMNTDVTGADGGFELSYRRVKG